MVSQARAEQTAIKRTFRLCEHPWLALLAIILASVASIALSSTVIFGVMGLEQDSPAAQFIGGIAYHVITVFVLAPFLLHLPEGKRTFRQYLDDIGLSKMQPFIQLVALALSCYLILALSQAAASFIYRFLEGLPIDGGFVRQVFDLSGDLPPRSSSLLVAIPSSFEEIAFRGIALTTFLNKYPKHKAIVFSAIGFGLIHVLNLASGRELVWVMGQIIWASSIGLFYGYVFVKTRSLLPSMIVHYLGNVFIGSLTAYLQSRASIELQALYGVVFSLGIVPTTLMILWTRWVTARWLQGTAKIAGT